MKLGTATAVAAALTLAVGGTIVGSADTATAAGPARAAAPTAACRTLAGHSFTVSTDVGFVERLSYNANDTAITATVIQGGPFGLPAGEVLTEQISTAQLTQDVYLVSWVESGGFTVSEAQNLRTGAVNLFWTYPNGSGGQTGEEHTGTITCASS